MSNSDIDNLFSNTNIHEDTAEGTIEYHKDPHDNNIKKRKSLWTLSNLKCFLPAVFILLFYFSTYLPGEFALFFHIPMLLLLIFCFHPFTDVNSVLTFLFTASLVFHLLYKLNQFKIKGTLMGSLSNCSWDKMHSDHVHYCYNILDYKTPGLAVPWIGLIAESLSDVILGFGKSFMIFVSNYQGEKIINLLIAGGTGSLLVLVCQYSKKLFNTIKERYA